MASHALEEDIHDHGHHSTRLYWMTALVLVILTSLEVALYIINQDELIAKWIEIVLLLILSFIKGSLVVATFMHLRGDAGVFKFLVFVPFLVAGFMWLTFVLIYSGGHVGIAG